MNSARGTLQEYNRKRRFSVTPEPEGKKQASKGSLTFCIQKHDASHLHYDFRLELDGVLKSWAVPKGPSVNPADRRLAVQVEDHPIDYGSFEGTIPEGEYGGGTVMLWDRGTWEPDGEDPAKDYERGNLTFELNGEKLHGRWHLRRFGASRGGKPNWFLMKGRDDYAADTDVTEELPQSVKTGRSLEEIADGVRKPSRAKHPRPRARQNPVGCPVMTRRRRARSPGSRPPA
jgi:bifunctional non-homologous end joining protein LigD